MPWRQLDLVSSMGDCSVKSPMLISVLVLRSKNVIMAVDWLWPSVSSTRFQFVIQDKTLDLEEIWEPVLFFHYGMYVYYNQILQLFRVLQAARFPRNLLWNRIQCMLVLLVYGRKRLCIGFGVGLLVRAGLGVRQCSICPGHFLSSCYRTPTHNLSTSVNVGCLMYSKGAVPMIRCLVGLCSWCMKALCCATSCYTFPVLP